MRRLIPTLILIAPLLSAATCRRETDTSAVDGASLDALRSDATSEGEGEGGIRGLDRIEEEAIEALIANFKRVHFETDSAQLTADSQDALVENGEILKQTPTLLVEIQGHCDERGTTDYNLALGLRRAEAVRRALVLAGVQPDRLEARSMGEEFPLREEGSEVAWSENRRAEFRITRGEGLAAGTTD